MVKQESLILEIQEDCLDKDVSVATILRKARVVATKLELKEFLKWLADESDGYSCGVEEIPEYRILTGTPKALNLYHGWQAIVFSNQDVAKAFSTAHINQAIGPMEDMEIRKPNDGVLYFPYDPKRKAKLSSMLENPADVHLELGEGSITGIINKVRNILLDWTLKLETSGVLGEGLSFNKDDKVEATAITQNFFANTIAVSSFQDQASITNVQNSYHLPFSIGDVTDLINQTKKAASQLPVEVRTNVQNHIEQIDEEIKKDEPEPSRIKSALTSLKTICEGATGNLTAQGILSLIGNLLK